jgi:dGTPase
VLQHASVSAEFRTWIKRRSELETADRHDLRANERLPGYSLELLRRRLHVKDGWMVDDEAFAVAVGRVGTDLVDGLLAVPFDSSLAAERLVGEFTRSWIAHLQDSVLVSADPPPRTGHVSLDRQAWHEVAVLKFVHQRFVLDRPDLAMFQRGQGQVMSALVADLDSWLADPVDAARAPRRLIDLVELATDSYHQLRRSNPALLITSTGEAGGAPDDLVRWGRGRGIIDYVASLTDDRAANSATTLAGHAARLWDAGSAL